MQVLFIKTSSMGDVLHALAAIEDASLAIPGIKVDWLIEEAFAEIPRWHASVNQVIPVALRRWRKAPAAFFNGEVATFLRQLRACSYDLIIDAQGLLKSAVWARLARGRIRHGFDHRSSREPLSRLFYSKAWFVPPSQHAVTRLRQLMAQILGYECPDHIPNYGINRERLPPVDLPAGQVVFLHATTWDTKHWPITYWCELGRRVERHGLQVLLPWGTSNEQLRAQTIAASLKNALVLPRLRLIEIASLLVQSLAVVAVDTGLGHLAAALGVPTISLYGPTDATLTGAFGLQQQHIQASFPCAPCLSQNCRLISTGAIQPPCFTATLELAWQKLEPLMER